MRREPVADDRSTLSAVRRALGNEPRIDLSRNPVALALDGDVLTMEGEVAGVAAKRLALERAAAVSGCGSSWTASASGRRGG